MSANPPEPPPEMTAEAFGRAVRAARMAKGLTQGDVSRLARTSSTQVSRWERGEQTPYPTKCAWILDRLNAMPPTTPRRGAIDRPFAPAWSFGGQVRRSRMDARITQTELARRADCELAVVRRIEGDGSTPGAELRQRLADALGVPVETLAGTDGPPQQPEPAAEALVAPPRAQEQAPQSAAPRMDSDRYDDLLTFRGLAIRFASALALAELTVDALRPDPNHPAILAWARELEAIDHALRDAGYKCDGLTDAAQRIGARR